jgi:hypothetical protein
LDLATYNANKPPTSQVHKTLPGVPLDGAVVSGTPSLTGESMPVENALGCLLITLLAGGRARAASRARSDRRDSKYRRDAVTDLGSGACTP